MTALSDIGLLPYYRAKGSVGLAPTVHGADDSLLLYRFLDAINNVADILIRHIRPCGETHANLEDGFFHTVGIDVATGIDGLLVHGLPHGSALDFLAQHPHTHGLDVVVGLAVGDGTIDLMDDARGTAHGSLDDFPVGVLLPTDLHAGVEGHGAEPVVAIEG